MAYAAAATLLYAAFKLEAIWNTSIALVLGGSNRKSRHKWRHLKPFLSPESAILDRGSSAQYPDFMIFLLAAPQNNYC